MAGEPNPFQGALNPNMARGASLWDLRMMSAANRMESPFERGISRSMYSHQGYGGNPMLAQLMGGGNTPDYSIFTTDPAAHAQATQALAPYGMHPLEAGDVKRNTFLPNSGFFGNHPRLSGALEGAAYGAMAAHGGTTVGDSIQGALEGMIGGQRLRQGAYNAQFARPFEAAGMMEGLQDMRQKRDLQDADIQHLRAMNEHLKRGDDLKFQQDAETDRHKEALEALGYQKLDATAPRNLGGGLYGVYNPRPYGHGAGVFPATPEQGYNPNQKGDWLVQENPEYKAGRAAEGAGPWYSYKDSKGGTRYGRVHEGANVPEGAQLVQGDYAEKHADKLTDQAASARQKFISSNAAKPGALWMLAGVAPGDPNATQKLGAFYDKNIKGEGMAGLEPGTVQDGHMYRGGDPSDKNSWMPIGTAKK